jgi:hypothetical protein
MTLIGQSTTIAKDLVNTNGARWTPALQDAFSNYMGQVIDGWVDITSLALYDLFDGSDESIKILEEAMSNGRLIDGSFDEDPPTEDNTTQKNDLRANIKCYFRYSIPALWQASKTYAFIIDAGYACGSKDLTDYLEDDTMDATGACVDGRQYYLVYPDGDANECHEVCHNTGPCNKYAMTTNFQRPRNLIPSPMGTSVASPGPI